MATLTDAKYTGHDFIVARALLCKALNVESSVGRLEPTSDQTGGVFAKGHKILVPPGYGTEYQSTMAALNATPPALAAWGRYCYGNNPVWDDEMAVTVELWKRVQPALTALGIREKTRERLHGFAWACQQNHRYLIRHKGVLYTPVALQGLLHVDASHWARDWCPRWEAFQAVLNEMDTEMLSTLLDQRDALVSKKKKAGKATSL